METILLLYGGGIFLGIVAFQMALVMKLVKKESLIRGSKKGKDSN